MFACMYVCTYLSIRICAAPYPARELTYTPTHKIEKRGVAPDSNEWIFYNKKAVSLLNLKRKLCA